MKAEKVWVECLPSRPSKTFVFHEFSISRLFQHALTNRVQHELERIAAVKPTHNPFYCATNSQKPTFVSTGINQSNIMSHLSQYAKTFKEITPPTSSMPYHPSQLYANDDSENASVGSVENLDSLHHLCSKHARRPQEWPWKKYLPEQYAIPSKDPCEHDDPDHQCEFCGPPAPTNAAYLKAYHAPLPSLLE
jgi:hypothetical protein